MPDVELIKWLNSIGALGLGFIVWALMKGHLVTRRELDRESARADRLETKLDKALEYGARAIGAGEKLVENHANNG